MAPRRTQISLWRQAVHAFIARNDKPLGCVRSAGPRQRWELGINGTGKITDCLRPGGDVGELVECWVWPSCVTDKTSLVDCRWVADQTFSPGRRFCAVPPPRPAVRFQQR